jgi:Major capsid protein N-terminus
LFTNAHFKPFAAIGFEYNKTTPQSGSTSLSSNLIFSIPQFGDFFHDMVVYVKLLQPTLTLTAASVSNQPLMRWCDYPGERIFETVEFEVNGNPLDQYYDYSVNFFREFSVQPNKKLGWDRCMGQEEPEQGFINQPNWVNSGVAPAGVNWRVGFNSKSGDQTPTGQKNTAVYKELLVPLQFWCNKDVRLAVPSVAIPYGQRFIKISLCDPQDLVNLVPRGTGDWTDANIGGSLNYSNMLNQIELYINNILNVTEINSACQNSC